MLGKKVAKVLATPNWFRTSFPEQIAFINETRHALGQCTRRSGKSYGVGVKLYKAAYENPGVSVLYLAPSREQAKRIMWKDVLRIIDTTYKFGSKFDPYDMSITLGNGSVIYLDGGDSSYKSVEKIRGQKLKLVVIDEAASFINDLEAIVKKVILPALADHSGQLVMISTTNDFVNSYFARATRGEIDPNYWQIYKWTSSSNPHTKKQIAKQMAEFRASNPKVDSAPWFRQEYLNEWVVNDDSRLYRYNPELITLGAQPDTDTYYLGIHLGLKFVGFCILGANRHRRDTWVVETLKLETTDLYQILDVVKQYETYYEFAYVGAYGPSPQLLKELQIRFSTYFHDVSTQDLIAIKRLFVSDLAKGYIKVVDAGDQGENKVLTDEWDSIILDSRPSARDKLREHPLSPSCVASATLYAWFSCHSYSFTEATLPSEDPIDAHWNKKHGQIQYRNPDVDPIFGEGIETNEEDWGY